jgi:tetratricopeptide (TPR) repeat protein
MVGRLIWVLGAAFCAGCVATGDGMPHFAADAAAAQPPPPGTVRLSPLAAYLAGRVAEQEHDDTAALSFFQAALTYAPGDPELMGRVFVLAAGAGRFDLARPLARQILTADPDAPLAGLVQAIEDLKAKQPAAALAVAQHLPDDGFYRFVGSFARAWLQQAVKAPPATAIAALDPVKSEPVFAPVVSVHTALIEDLAGDTEAASRAYTESLGDHPPPLRLAQLAGNFFERIGDKSRAAEIYRSFAENGGAETGVTLKLDPNGKPARLVPDATSGLAEAMFNLAGAINQADSPEVAMLAIRMALELQPDFPLATLTLGDILETEERPDEALTVYRSLKPDSPYAWAARLRAVGPQDETGDHQGAEAALRAMAAERPGEAQPLIELGNLLRNHEAFGPAVEAYTAALGRLTPDALPRYWSLYYSRGIARERSGDWQGAEADLRHALALQPDQADVLNYLGFSMVDRSIHLQEALNMIRRAVELKPKDGFFVDSLGWAYYRIGKFSDAEEALEKAVELRPADAEINDHLGDAYWQGGRRDEARLQWRRALSLKPEGALAKAIETKLDHPPARHAATASH